MEHLCLKNEKKNKKWVIVWLQKTKYSYSHQVYHTKSFFTQHNVFSKKLYLPSHPLKIVPPSCLLAPPPNTQTGRDAQYSECLLYSSVFWGAWSASFNSITRARYKARPRKAIAHHQWYNRQNGDIYEIWYEKNIGI